MRFPRHTIACAKRRWLLLATLAVPASVAVMACATPSPGQDRRGRGDHPDHWANWQDLTPLVEAAQPFVDKETREVLKQASKLLRVGAARSADQLLRPAASGPHGAWISVARANLLALHFTRCIRGVAWRVEDLTPETTRRRSVDFDPNTRLGPGDVSVEATLSNLERAFDPGSASALQRQARIARARMTTTVTTCPPNDAVAQMAQRTARGDLAALAASESLPPDLAFVWAQIQMSDYSAAAARPFLQRALDGGYLDPTVVYLLGVSALELREYEEASTRAAQAAEAYLEFSSREQAAQARALEGEARWRGGAPADARAAFDQALALDPGQPAAILGSARLLEAEPDAAYALLVEKLNGIYGADPLDENTVQQLTERLESLVYLADEDMALSQDLRDAMLDEIDVDEDPARRALRYFFAATLDARLGEFSMAHGRAAIAETEAQDAVVTVPVDIRAFLERVAPNR